MAAQSETVVLDARDQTSAATKSANANLASVEKSAAQAGAAAGKAGEAAGETVVKVTQRSQKQIEVLVTQIERRL